jgi:peptidoglycan/LPS O-acetylase OafA/YrhL
MVWPAAIFLVPRRYLKWLCLAVAAAALGARFYMGSHGFDSEAVYRMTPGRMDTLALGAFVAVGVRDFRGALERWSNGVLMLSTLAFLAVWSVNRSPVWSDLAMRTAGASLIAIVYACVVFRAATLRSGRIHSLLSSRLLRQCGKYSYAMYVLHSAPFHLTADWMHDLSLHGYPGLAVTAAKYLYFPALTLVAYGAARISWRFLEYPFIRLKDRFAELPASPRPQGNSRLAAATSTE